MLAPDIPPRSLTRGFCKVSGKFCQITQVCRKKPKIENVVRVKTTFWAQAVRVALIGANLVAQWQKIRLKSLDSYPLQSNTTWQLCGWSMLLFCKPRGDLSIICLLMLHQNDPNFQYPVGPNVQELPSCVCQLIWLHPNVCCIPRWRMNLWVYYTFSWHFLTSLPHFVSCLWKAWIDLWDRYWKAWI